MKRNIVGALAIGCSLAAFGAGSATWTDSSNVPWIFTWQSDGTATIGNGSAPSAENKAKYAGNVVVPATVYRDGEPYKVTAIEANALNGCTLMESVTIPAGVASIGNAAFKGCTSLEHVTFKSTFPTSSNFANVFNGTKFYQSVYYGNGNDSVNFPDLFPGDGSVKTVKDSNFLASVCGTEEDWASISTDHSTGCVTKWFRWTPQKSGTVWFDTTDSVFDTLLYVYRANTKTEVAKNNDFTKTGGSQVMFNAVAGVEYYICVGGNNGARGAYTLALRTGTPVTLTLDPNGGVFSGADVPTKFSVPKNVAVGVLPTPVKDGYACAWYTAKSGGTKVTASTKFTKATKIYARWTKNKFKVVVKTEGTGAKTVKGGGTYAWGTKVKLSATPKSGYVFKCWVAQNSASENAFPNYSKASRKKATATVTVPKDSGLAYKAYFVKKSSDGMSLDVLPSATLYAEDGAGSAAIVDAASLSYPTVKTSKLPAGVKFSLVAFDNTYKLVITDPDKIPAGKNVIKITATNRSGKKDSKNVVVWGKNKTQAIDNNALYVTEGLSAKAPKEIYTGVKYKLADWGVSTAMGWKVTKIAGLPSGITWDAKNQTLKGYTKKTGMYNFTFTVAKGKTKYTATATFQVKALPAKAQGTFRGYAGEHNEFGTFFNGNSRRVTVSVTKDGKVSAKVGSLSLSCTGLTYDPSSGRFMASMKSTSKTNKKNVTRIRSLGLEIDPAAAYSENSLDGRYYEYTQTKTSHGISQNLIVDYDIEGRKNVFGRDADTDLPLFEGAGVAQEALEKAFSVYPYHVISFDGGSATVTLDSGKNGNVTLSGTYNGKSFSESAVLWYEVNPGDPSIRYLRFWSFSIGQPISYVLKYDGGILQTVSAPAVPEG